MFKEFALKEVEEIKNQYTKKEQQILQLNSVKNFLLYFSSLETEKEKQEVESLIKEYFGVLKSNNLIINRSLRNEITLKFISKIGLYYRTKLGFKFFDYTPLIPILQGLLVDIVLYFLGIFKIIPYFPIATLSMLSYWIYLKIILLPQNKVYGI